MIRLKKSIKMKKKPTRKLMQMESLINVERSELIKF